MKSISKVSSLVCSLALQVVFIIQRDMIILDSTLCFAVQRVQLKARVSVLVYIMEDFSYLNKMGEILKIFL